MIDISARTRILAWLATVPFLLVILMFEIAPLLAVAANSIQTETSFSLSNYREILTSKFYLGSFKVSFLISVATALIGLGIGLPAAVLLKRMPGRVQQLIVICSNIGANFTGFPLAFAFVIMLGVSGSFTLLLQRIGLLENFNIYSTSGLVIAYSYFQILFAILLVLPSLAAITVEIEEAAHLVGASRFAFWRRIGLPILAPSLLGSFLLLFANAMGTYATAWALVGGSANVVTIRIGELTAGDVFSDPYLADALAMLLVVSLILPIVVEQLFLKTKDRER
ncbi:ABC transporter permease subunit [Nordella sp. HKS 07]|uniref:ABC transporter permease n=1 Tax=Nordella sp. HKS 07 TaxID=2712222 RepID=UPI0013E1F2E3|nr:ABC transporter permease subunit [Nordella sp. HKS 07]QIG48972.1 ABC transporter permease subunit [Nordella sp. HKS 07]